MRTVVSIVFVLLSFQLTAQVYLETFSDQEGTGIQGACDSIPLSCDTVNIPSSSGWTIIGDASGMVNAEDYLLVIAEELQGRDTDGELCFVSPMIDLTYCDTSRLRLRIDETGDLEMSDYVDVSIMADTTRVFLADVLGSGDSTHTLVGDFPDDLDWQSVDVELKDIVADSGRISICLSNNSGTETIRFDDVEVSCQPASIAPDVYISELDCDQPGPDTAEFIEIGGISGQSLDHVVLVLFNGSDDASYAAYDLMGEQLNDEGLFTICFGDHNATYCDLIGAGQIQNGADGAGLYYGVDIDDFPNDSPLSAEGLIDGLRYATGEAPDSGLAILDVDADCPESCQINELPTEYSIQRGSWFVANPTPGAINTQPLAVEWMNFTAKYKYGASHLSWSTSSEYENSHFVIEYARDRGAFDGVGRVDGNHSSSGIDTYNYVHYPGRTGNHYYYRIRAVDVDGHSDYSGVRVVERKAEPDVSIWPTIAQNTFHVRWPEGKEGALRLYDLAGQLALQADLGERGYLELDVSTLTPGMYVVQLSSGPMRMVRRIVVQSY